MKYETKHVSIAYNNLFMLQNISSIDCMTTVRIITVPYRPQGQYWLPIAAI